MTLRTALSTAALISLSLPVFAQDVRVPGPASEGKGKGAPVFASVTVFGCIERESDYRAAHDKGHGGLIGTGIGVKNEFILAGATSGRPVGTSGSASDSRHDYQLTGAAEGDAGKFVGKRVEISGHFKTGSIAAARSGEASNDAPATIGELDLRQFEVLLVKSASGSCR